MQIKNNQLTQTLAVLGLVGSSSIVATQPGLAADLLALDTLKLVDTESLEAASPTASESAKAASWLHEPVFSAQPPRFTGSGQRSKNTAAERQVLKRQRLRQTAELAQNTPAGENVEPEDELIPLPEAEPVLPESEPATEPPTPAPSNGEVLVNDVQVVGSTVFNDADFAPILADYEGRSLGIRELRQMADEITQLYLESGYITSRAVLSEQTIVDGVVQVRVVEGSLESIRVEGTDRLADYVRDRVNLANRQPLSQVALESQLQLLRADPLVERIEASLRAGTGEGQSQLIVRVLEAPAFSGRAVFDTNSPPSVGVARMGVEANYNNILGLGDRLSASAFRTTTGGSNTYGLTYTLPLNAMNGTLQARYLPSSFELIDPALASLGVEGSSNTYELTYRQPLIRKPNEELALSLGLRHRTGETLISDVVIDSTRTSVIQFGQDYLKRDRSGAWGLRSQFNIGTGLFDATTRPSGQADGQFFSWLGQVQRAQVISRDNLLLMQASLQLASESLLGADQFIVGGPSSVRGYSQNARFGDNGFRASIEDRATVLRNEDGSPAVQIAPFIDTALIWNQGVNTSDQRFLLGTGVGLIANVVEDVQARFDVGVPLVELDEAGDSPQDVFIYFSMDYRF
ncbi:MAG: ShlB/FhaC/HecB family hemolysin secretion/activation protein [Cyanobacteria bacterium J06621_3]